jgi:hypothetical protein
MNIKELEDIDILDFLMTSEFEENYSPEEFRYLLNKWRYFYRLSNGKFNRLKDDNEFEINKLKNKLELLKHENDILKIDNNRLEDDFVRLIGKKLTFKERLKGKIII